LDLQARNRGPPLLGDSTIYGIVPDWPHQGDFDNPKIMLGSAPPGGLQTIYNLEAGSAPSRGHQQSLSARKGPLRGARSCPTCWGSPVRSALSLTLIAHYPPLPIPELSSRDICSRPNEAGEKRERSPRAADPTREALLEDLVLLPDEAPYNGPPAEPTAFLASAESS
jgi:hypothetical protein